MTPRSRARSRAHLAAGASYWKTCIPRELVVDGASLSDEDARFWSEVYTLGLGEFFYRNGIDPTGRASFRARSGAPAPAGRSAGSVGTHRFFCGVAGRTPSVSHEVLKAAGEAHELLSIGRVEWEWVRRSATVAGEPLARRLAAAWTRSWAR